MKNKLVSIVVFLAASVFAQSTSTAETPSIGTPAPREHRGFYSSVSSGAAYNWYKNSKEEFDEDSFGETRILDRDIDYFEYNGFTYPMLEFKFGVGLANLLAVYTVFNLGFISGTMDEGFRSYRRECDKDSVCVEYLKKDEMDELVSSDAYTFRTYVGFGSTVYPIQDKQSPLNGLFVGGSVGYTLFVTLINGGREDTSGNGGVTFQVELGKEWWVNDHLSIGVGLGYAHSSLVWQTVDSHDSDNLISLSFRLTRG